MASFSVIALLIIVLLSFVSGIFISAGVCLCVLAIKLNNSIRMGSDWSDFEDVTQEPLHIIRKEERIK